MTPRLYLGVDRVANTDRAAAARIVVTPLPGQAGVAMDYEIFKPETPDRLRGHVEHTMIARTHLGPNVMVISDMHAPSVGILRETEPGVFEAGDEPTPYPMKGVLSMPEADHLRHAWWFGALEKIQWSGSSSNSSGWTEPALQPRRAQRRF